jgi:hypothetical protein
MSRHVELVYFDGCPNVERARANLRSALEMAGQAPVWKEWEGGDPAAPPGVRHLPSPTVLVDGRDVTGEEVAGTGASCRAAGAPSVAVIRAALAQNP